MPRAKTCLSCVRGRPRGSLGAALGSARQATRRAGRGLSGRTLQTPLLACRGLITKGGAVGCSAPSGGTTRRHTHTHAHTRRFASQLTGASRAALSCQSGYTRLASFQYCVSLVCVGLSFPHNTTQTFPLEALTPRLAVLRRRLARPLATSSTHAARYSEDKQMNNSSEILTNENQNRAGGTRSAARVTAVHRSSRCQVQAAAGRERRRRGGGGGAARVCTRWVRAHD